jgi:hypothetical protein
VIAIICIDHVLGKREEDFIGKGVKEKNRKIFHIFLSIFIEKDKRIFMNDRFLILKTL